LKREREPEGRRGDAAKAEKRMTTALLIERWVAISFLIVGVSHALHPKEWAALLWPAKEAKGGAFLLGALALAPGLAIVLGHNLWVWSPSLLVTIVGWGMATKGIVYLFWPGALRRVIVGQEELERRVRLAGALMIPLGLAVAIPAFLPA
jgi:hypothetical protein